MRPVVFKKPLIEALEVRRLLHGGDEERVADDFASAAGATYVDASGLEWEGGLGFTTTATTQTVASNNAIAGTDLDPLFKSTRQDFNMKFAVDVPDGKYDVSLYFAEQRYGSAGQRVFDVDAESATVLHDFDIYKAANAKNTAVVRTFAVTVADGTLNLDFPTGAVRASINGVRVQPAETTPTTGGTFKPGTIGWSTKASAPITREETVSFVANGKLYAIGGYINSKFEATTRVDAYDPSTNKWSRKKDAPTKITHSGVATDPSTGTVWMCGGFIGNLPNPQGTTTVWKYSPGSDTWTKGPSLPAGKAAGGAAVIGGKLYYFSGSNADRKSDSSACYVLDLGNQSAGWKSIASMPAARNHFGTAVVGGKAYVIGGAVHLQSATQNKSDVYVYDPDTDKWTSTTGLPKAYSHFTSSISVYEGRYILIAGGEAPHNTALSDVMLFDTQTKKWAKLTSLPSARRAGSGGIIGGKFYFSGGYKAGYHYTTTWSADLAKLGL